MVPVITETGDGSHTLYLKEIDEHYHSVHGAISESMHIFIGCGLNYIDKKTIHIFEVGFGTGLNCLLTAIRGGETHKTIHYVSVDKYPVLPDILEKLNYGSIIKGAFPLYDAIIKSGWGTMNKINSGFMLSKYDHDATTGFPTQEFQFDLVYFDAFSPSKQPAMWSPGIFLKIAEMTAPGGVLVTYSSKGDVRRALQSGGFSTEKLPGPAGKREILRGIKKIQ